MFLAPKNFWEGSPKILDRDYKNWTQRRASCKISRRSADGARRLRRKKKWTKNLKLSPTWVRPAPLVRLGKN